MRQGHWRAPVDIDLPSIPGVDFVGRIYAIDSILSKRTGFGIGDRVTSLCTTGGNTRYIAIDHQDLVRVPDTLDAALATCLPETYLAAFQALHHSHSNAIRYKKSALRGRSVLIVGYIHSNLGRAVAELAHAAGVRIVYGTAESKHFQQVHLLRIVPISPDITECSSLHGEIDLIVSLDQAVDFRYSHLLKRCGEIVIICERPVASWNKQVNTKQAFCSRRNAQITSKTIWYDVHEQWKTHRELCKMDISHIITLVENQDIKPYVLDRIPLTKVGKMHEFIGNKRLSGFLVCEPWFVRKTRAIRL
jgi:NADPH:quinone reductase-like Zn-dependent oxidoreductase